MADWLTGKVVEKIQWNDPVHRTCVSRNKRRQEKHPATCGITILI